jgi:hypothetical protein
MNATICCNTSHFFRFVLFFVCLLPCNLFAQYSAEKALQVMDEKHPQEKLHLFLNKEAYLAGETIYFKAYAFSGYVQSLISNHLYVELYNDKKQVLANVQIPLLQGTGSGSVKLDSKLSEGVYFIRAYTKWMANFDEGFQYLLRLPVYNPLSAKRLTVPKVSWSAAAYPESGVLLGGEVNKVVVRLTARGSLPDAWKGELYEKGNGQFSPVTFQSLNSQFASFQFQPKVGRSYLVRLTDASGNDTTIALPTVAASGVLLKAEQLDDLVKVETRFRGFPNGGENCKVLGHIQNQVVFSAIIRKKDSVAKAYIPMEKLMNGVLHLTLFDPNERPLAERLLFVMPDSVGPAKLTIMQASKNPRGLNQLMLTADTAQLQNYAVSVVDADASGARARSLFSDLWLGDFASDIHQPQWYFTPGQPNKAAALDALLITEKWTRFSWNEILTGKFPETLFKPEKFLSFTGTLTDGASPLRNHPFSLFMRFKDSSIQFAQFKSDALGKFHINNVAFYDTVSAYSKNASVKDKGLSLDLSFETVNRPLPYKRSLPPTGFVLADRQPGSELPLSIVKAQKALQGDLSFDSSFKKLDVVTVKAKAKTPAEQLNSQLASELFNSGESTLFDFVNQDQGIMAYNSILDWLEGRVPGLNFTVVDGVRMPVMRDEPVPCFLDEIPVDIDVINTLPISDIAMVKVIRGYFLGNLSTSTRGAIAVYTRRAGGPGGGKAVAPRRLLPGYHMPAPFEVVDYTNPNGNRPGIDSRIQLLWNYSLVKNASGQTVLSFHNSDVAKKVRVVVTGLDKDARPIFIDTVIE